MTLLILALALIGCGGSAAPESDVEPPPTEASTPAPPNAAEAPEAPPSPEARGARCDWEVQGGVLVHPDLEGLEPVAPQEVDLDGVEPMDLIANLGACGSRGDCDHVVLQACESGGYRAVWGPDYAQGLDVAARDGTTPLADLVKRGRTGTPGCDLPTQTTLRWTGERWEPTGKCAGKGSWGPDCGPRPRACED